MSPFGEDNALGTFRSCGAVSVSGGGVASWDACTRGLDKEMQVTPLFTQRLQGFASSHFRWCSAHASQALETRTGVDESLPVRLRLLDVLLAGVVCRRLCLLSKSLVADKYEPQRRTGGVPYTLLKPFLHVSHRYGFSWVSAPSRQHSLYCLSLNQLDIRERT